MTRPLIWYDEQESGIELGELWDLLLRHRLVEGPLPLANSIDRMHVESFAADLHVELVRSEVERMRAPPGHSQEWAEGFGGDAGVTDLRARDKKEKPPSDPEGH